MNIPCIVEISRTIRAYFINKYIRNEIKCPARCLNRQLKISRCAIKKLSPNVSEPFGTMGIIDIQQTVF